MNVIGVTGTRKGLTQDQYDALSILVAGDHIRNFWRGKVELHHGDCKGADRQVHMFFYDYCRGLNRGKAIRKLQYHIHPGHDRFGRSPSRAYCPIEKYLFADVVYESKFYLDRDRDIVNAATVMLVFPDSFEERLRSGTWSTFRMARRRQLDEKWNGYIYVLWPDGYIQRVTQSTTWTGNRWFETSDQSQGDIAG